MDTVSAKRTCNAMRGLLTRTHVTTWRGLRALQRRAAGRIWGLAAVGVTPRVAQGLNGGGWPVRQHIHRRADEKWANFAPGDGRIC